MCRFFFLILAVILFVSGPRASIAVEPGEVLDDPQLETRARNISVELRCLVCQNQSIDDSNAPLAKDLRILVRERLTKGDSDRQVIDFIVARYGEFVLLRPRFGWHTFLLWLAPPAILILAATAMFFSWRRQQGPADSGKHKALTADEQNQLKKLLSGD